MFATDQCFDRLDFFDRLDRLDFIDRLDCLDFLDRLDFFERLTRRRRRPPSDLRVRVTYHSPWRCRAFVAIIPDCAAAAA